jgi:hypothetical protein
MTKHFSIGSAFSPLCGEKATAQPYSGTARITYVTCPRCLEDITISLLVAAQNLPAPSPIPLLRALVRLVALGRDSLRARSVHPIDAFNDEPTEPTIDCYPEHK